MIWENWLIAVSVGIIALAFVILIVYVILALLSIKSIVNDLDAKVRSFDPLFRIVNKAGNVIEKKADQELSDAQSALEREREVKHRGVNAAIEVAEWALIGLSLWQKFKERRR